MSRRNRRRENRSSQTADMKRNRASEASETITHLEVRFKAGITGLVTSLLETLPELVPEREYVNSMRRLAAALRAAATLLDHAAGLVGPADGAATPTPEANIHVRVSPVRLNASQLEILRLLDTGLRPQEIARRLHLAVSTVYWRLGQVNKLVGTRSYDASLLIAREQGLLEIEA